MMSYTIGKKDLTKDAFVIAEIGNNHEGDFEVAKELVCAAADTGVDAVKFQTIVPEKFISIDQTERMKTLKRFQLSCAQYEGLAKLAEERGVYFMSTPFDLESVHFLDSLVPAFKVASSDNTFFPLLDLIASKNKPILISTGMVNLPYLKTLEAQLKGKTDSFISFLHCVTSYPAAVDDANLNAILAMRESLNSLIGYSDHTMGIDASVLSVALGAKIVEKHFTLDHYYSEFRDHQLSANPKEMKLLVEKIRLANQLLGEKSKSIRTCEIDMEKALRRSAAASRNMNIGEKVDEESIIWLRSERGIRYHEKESLLGRVLDKEVKSGELF